MRFTLAALILSQLFILASGQATAARLDFVGEIKFVDTDLNRGVFKGSDEGTQISGYFDDDAKEIQISNGTQVLTSSIQPPDENGPVSISISVINNDQQIDPLTASLFNAILGEPAFSGGEIRDFYQLGVLGEFNPPIDETVGAGLFLLFLYEQDVFDETVLDPGLNFPEGQILSAFAISEFADGGEPIYVAGGELQVVPLPASIWFLITGLSYFFIRRQVK